MSDRTKLLTVRPETRLLGGALRAGAVLVVPGAGIAAAIRGVAGVVAVVAALGMVVGNLVVSAGVLAWASRRWPESFPAVALPSYALRMAAVFVGMAVAHQSGVDPVVFSVAFGGALVAVLAYECYLWAKTPWLALTLKERT